MIAKRTDANQAEVIEALRRECAGVFIQSLAGVGCGTPDLLVCWRGRVTLIEIKDGDKPPSHRCLTDPECRWHKLAAAAGVEVFTVTSGAEAVAAVQEEGR